MTRIDPTPVPRAVAAAPMRGAAAWPRRLVRTLAAEYTVLVVTVAYFAAASLFVPELTAPRNLSNLLTNMLPLLAVAIGQTVVLITGGIDLSVTSIIAAASVAAGWAMTSAGAAAGQHLPNPAGIWPAVALALAVGAGVGLLNGAAITALRMPPFVVTLSTMMALGGAALWVTKSRNFGNLPEAFTALGYGDIGGVPAALVVVAALALLAHILLTHTLPGRWLYATGHNPTASLISGVPVRRVTAAAYVVSGACAAVAALIYTARLESGSPTMGREILLDVIGATVIGGTSLFGGRGKVPWTVLGVFLFELINNTLNLYGLEYYTIMSVKGAVILAAAGIDLARARLLARSAAP